MSQSVRVDISQWRLRFEPDGCGLRLQAIGQCILFERRDLLETQVEFRLADSAGASARLCPKRLWQDAGDGEFLLVTLVVAEPLWGQIWDKALLAKESFVTFQLEIETERAMSISDVDIVLGS